MNTQDNHFDVIIVGGRPAGATLAARLGQQGVRVLLVDRAKFPSLPAISSPAIYPCTMQLLDEIGADEAEYAYNTPKIRRIVVETRDEFRGTALLPDDYGRDYAYAPDRQRFDYTLWKVAKSNEHVTAWDEFAVIDLLWNGDHVVGITGKPKGETIQSYSADTVIGADGRWSLVARKVNAAVYNEVESQPTAYYYAYWTGVARYDLNEPLIMTHGEGDGIGYLVMDSADDTTVITVGSFSNQLIGFKNIQNDAEALYTALMQNAPRIWARVKDAKRVSTVRGIKHIDNFYRQSYGKGWALVGDAVHHKDPLGGQGIYDAVFGAKVLTEAYLDYRQGTPWKAAMESYKQRLETETLTMYHNTIAATANYRPVNRLQLTINRYISESPDVLEKMLAIPARVTDPSTVTDVPLLTKTLVSGLARDARRMMTGEPSPAALPPLPKDDPTKIVPRTAGGMGCLGWILAFPAIMFFGMLGLNPFSRRK